MKAPAGRCAGVLPELGVMERVDGRWGGALPPSPTLPLPGPGDGLPGSRPADRDPYSCFISTSCLQKIILFFIMNNFKKKNNKTKYPIVTPKMMGDVLKKCQTHDKLPVMTLFPSDHFCLKKTF